MSNSARRRPAHGWKKAAGTPSRRTRKALKQMRERGIKR